MTCRISKRIAKLEKKLCGAKDHFVIAEDHAEAELIHARWHEGPFSKMPGHHLYVIVSNMPKKNSNL